jgi:anti-sigma28 factor (negative regulator of flagellin synthesis)
MDQRPPRRRTLRRLSSQTPDTGIAHEQRLRELKRQVEDGTYDADPRKIAREILREGLESS